MIFIKKGDKPLSIRQATHRGLQLFENEKPFFLREEGVLTQDPEYMAWAGQWLADNQVNSANNLFNHQLVAYRKAVARLAQYEVANGRTEVTEEVSTFTSDEEGNEIFETVVVSPAIDPVPAQVEVSTYNEETGTETLTMITNPLIEADNTERSTAMYILSQIPQEVIDDEG